MARKNMWYVALALTAFIGILPERATATTNQLYPLAIPYLCTANYYVDSVNGNDANLGTYLTGAWRTISHAETTLSGKPRPGACINVAPGTYLENVSLYAGGTANTTTGYAVLRCEISADPYLYATSLGLSGSEPRCFIKGPGGEYAKGIVSFLANYEIVDGFDITSSDLTGTEAGIEGGYATSGSTGNCPEASGACHHLAVFNSRVHSLGGAGIQMAWGAAWYVQRNEVFNTASRDVNQTSGITICCSSGKGYSGGLENTFGMQGGSYIQNLITNNVSHNNVIGSSVTGGHTDGEGIIVDTLAETQASCSAQNAHGTLIYGNVTYGNGGEGVSVFFSSYVAVYNNTAYNDFVDELNYATERSEFLNGCGHNNTFSNNAGLAVVGAGWREYNIAGTSAAQGQSGESSILWVNNVLGTIGAPTLCYGAPFRTSVVCAWNGDTISSSTNKYSVNPGWVGPAETLPNFLPATGSPLIGTSSATNSVTSLGGPTVTTLDIGAL